MPLTSKQRAFLRKKAHPIDPILRIGKEGIGSNTRSSILDAIDSRELIKVKIMQNCEMKKEDVVTAISQWKEIEIVGMIGKTIILYKENKDDPVFSLEMKSI